MSEVKCPFSQYKTIFGLPNEGAHNIRLFNLPIIDYIGSVIIALKITFITKIPFELIIIIVLIIGVLCHYLFGVETNLMKYFNIQCK